MAKTPGRSDLPAAPNPASPQDIRNVVLVGPGGAGKTALFEALVAARVPGQRASHATTSARRPSPPPRSTSGPVTLNLLDTPGYPDFVGDLRAGLRAADAAVFVVSGADDIDRPVSLLWRECAALGMPRAVVVTHLDQPRADFATTVETCRRTFGDARATHWPVVEDGSVTGVVGLTDGRHVRGPRGRPSALIESVIEESEDATLLDRYLEGESIDTESLLADLRTAIAHGHFLPSSRSSPLTGAGVEELLGHHRAGLPRPDRAPAPRPSPPPWAGTSRAWRATLPSHSWQRSCGRRPTPTSGACHSCGSSPAPCASTRPSTCRTPRRLRRARGRRAPGHDDDERRRPARVALHRDAPAPWHRHRR